MKILFVNHSCFIVEFEKYVLIFDYFKTPRQKDDSFKLSNYLDSEKKIIVFASHGHEDHYSDTILSWDNGKRDISYVLSDDIVVGQKKSNYYIIKENKVINVDGIEIHSFGSSDLGVSFLIDIENKSIFHAGDLNWWHWEEETKDEQKYAEDTFKGIMDNIIDYVKKNKVTIDCAFFPVDIRLENAKFWGGEYFVKNISPKVLIPMHCWGKFLLTDEFSKYIQNLNLPTKGIIINHNLEEIYL
ncbi:MAG: MBL fold metallo-hydrolase [Fusobacteriaceae bacterium]|jgi:L-ascorbate metabolism protein UlaG (beta-lactamase superfamily)|nr:MBL fold metallo-hydrolase [Fusobacteriaceae bacterium]